MDRVQRGGTAARALLASVIVMGVLIVAGVAVVGVTIVRRVGGSAAAIAPLTIDEPAGTRIVSASATGDRVVVVLQGGGPDRLVLLDGRSGLAVGHVTLRVAGP